MNIKPIKVGARVWSDIKLQRRGSGAMKSSIVKRFGFENKRIIISMDEDDKEYKFLYVSFDTKNNVRDSFILRSSLGTFHFGLGSFKEIITKIPGDCSVGFIFLKKMVNNGQPYFQFIREV